MRSGKTKIVILLAALLIVFLIPHAQAGPIQDLFDFLKKSGELKAPIEKISTSTPAAGKSKEVTLYKPVIDYEEAVVRAVETAEDSVVSIIVKKDLPIIERCPHNPFGDLPPEFRQFFGDDFGGFYRSCEKGTEKREVGGGSGFIVSSDGLIVTNKHVVLDTNAEYVVLTNTGKNYGAKVIAKDPTQDIAVLKIQASDLKPAKLGNSDSLKLGQTAIAIGNALGEFRNTVSVGVISGLARNITAGGSEGFIEEIEGVIQTDSAINQGNSGGPLLNLKGEVVGVNTAVAAGAENIGFAIPINQVKRAIQSVKATGSIKVPYLGVRSIHITPDFAKNQNLPVEYGALIRGSADGPGVIPNSPAEKAGLKAEDIILEVNGEKIKEKSLVSLIQKQNIGGTVVLKVQRGKEALIFRVKLEERPDL